MANYASNGKISAPVAVAATAHVDFNGFQWSYTIGLMFPPQAAATAIPPSLPSLQGPYLPAGGRK